MSKIPIHTLLGLLGAASRRHADGHVTILRFKSGWKVLLGAPSLSLCEQNQSETVPIAKTLEEAALHAVVRFPSDHGGSGLTDG